MEIKSNSSNQKPLKWLITGGCGFIATSLIRNLVAEGCHSIRILDNLSVGTQQDLANVSEYTLIGDYTNLRKHTGNTPCELVTNDIRDRKACQACVTGMDVIVHLAANTGVGPSVEDPYLDMETNVIGTVNLLEAARAKNVKKFIFASSGAPVGECTPPIHEELAPHPVSPYGASKLAGEGYCSAYARTFGLETVALRFGNVYGPGSGHKNSVIAKFIKKAINGEPLEIYGDGTQTRDFIYIDDLIRAIRLAQDTPNIGGEIFQIATNQETTIQEMTDILCRELKAAGIQNVTTGNANKRLGDVMRNYSDTAKARKMLQWVPHMALNAGLRKTISYFKED